jgi:hypothetical protein
LTKPDYSRSIMSWRSLLLPYVRANEYLVSTANWCHEWRAHVAWAVDNGASMKASYSARFSSSMVVMSLMLSSQITVLFSGTQVGDDIRQAMAEADYNDIALYIGILIICGMSFALLAIVSTYTVWGIILPISDVNVPAIFRSHMGLHVLSIPTKLVTAAIYTYGLWLTLLLFKLLPNYWGWIITALGLSLHVYVTFVQSALSQVIMYSNSMQMEPMFSEQDLKALAPDDLDKAFAQMVSSGYHTKRKWNLLAPTRHVNDIRDQYTPSNNKE